MKENIKLAEEWFRKAGNDLLCIANNLRVKKAPSDIVCFHSQQAIEKYLKGYLIYKCIEFKFVHDLVYLVNQVKPKEEWLLKLGNKLTRINEYASKIRYPFFYQPSLNEAKKAYQIALRIKKSILKRITDSEPGKVKWKK